MTSTCGSLCAHVEATLRHAAAVVRAAEAASAQHASRELSLDCCQEHPHGEALAGLLSLGSTETRQETLWPRRGVKEFDLTDADIPRLLKLLRLALDADGDTVVHGRGPADILEFALRQLELLSAESTNRDAILTNHSASLILEAIKRHQQVGSSQSNWALGSMLHTLVEKALSSKAGVETHLVKEQHQVRQAMRPYAQTEFSLNTASFTRSHLLSLSCVDKVESRTVLMQLRGNEAVQTPSNSTAFPRPPLKRALAIRPAVTPKRRVRSCLTRN
mmetsp:Transcript_44164/g.73291  ORF Transcript_44164/g.73291 Transcript_44164/m.73291 type:complete len:275 (+) Transcript_44164:17-841(+)